MALSKTKSTSLTGESKIDGVTVVRMTASLSTSGGSDYVNQSVLDIDRYNGYKKEVRKDIADFQEYVYEQQDAIDAEISADKTPKAADQGTDKQPA
ncbi:hypothetical protein [Limosilactobacillus fermentum]|uniref:hypothetical protein n=1 Tax=Limosilactobacillus fermentum TaxID=1613 RepID=UPI001E39CABF|nr:hypothetical protein [Limosilactobacillus fermentum]MCD5422993.1 hypothetical protein [Limosilactobacillus fermentum]